MAVLFIAQNNEIKFVSFYKKLLYFFLNNYNFCNTGTYVVHLLK